MVNRILRFVVCLVGACVLVVLLSGVGHLVLNPSADGYTLAGQTATALIAGTAHAEMPPGFEEAMGYLPDGTTKGDGSCSAPAAYPGFADACRTHDLGYDLLRFASNTGEPLGPWARLGIDRRFHGDMIMACDTFGCRFLAHVYGLVVGLNSVRQGFTTPTQEPVGPWAVTGLFIIAVAGAGSSSALSPSSTGSHRGVGTHVPLRTIG